MKKLVNGIEIDMSPEELAQRDKDIQAFKDNELNEKINKLRFFRNKFLADTDWMANSDVTMSDDWKTYRQQLRDLPSGLDTVEKVDVKLEMKDGKFINFPTKPSGE
jgi:hypothetical protein